MMMAEDMKLISSIDSFVFSPIHIRTHAHTNSTLLLQTIQNRELNMANITKLLADETLEFEINKGALNLHWFTLLHVVESLIRSPVHVVVAFALVLSYFVVTVHFDVIK